MGSDANKRDANIHSSRALVMAICGWGLVAAIILSARSGRTRRMPPSGPVVTLPPVRAATPGMSASWRRPIARRIIWWMFVIIGSISIVLLGLALGVGLTEEDGEGAAAPLPPSIASRDSGAYPRPARPIFPVATWSNGDDYPAASIRDRRAGTVTLGFGIDTAGRVHDCWPIRSGGSPLLDGTACGIVEERGRYYPARDPAGHRIASSVTMRFVWKLPE